MSRYLLTALAFAICVAAATSIKVPLSLEDIITGSWKLPFDSLDTAFELEGTNSSTITQRLDNYNPQNNATFEQRFFFNSRYFKAGGPIYVVLGGLGAASNYRLDYSLIASVARSENGNLFLLENRFFGESIPTADLSVDNLQYLTAEQSLADTAHFINHIKSITPGAQDSPVIVTGVHYGGSLAVWFRQKYPHLTAGAWASSAPLQALQNSQEYKVNAANTIRQLAGDACYNVIDAGFRGLEELANDGKIDELSTLLNVCDEQPLETTNDVATLFLVISEIFSSISTFRPALYQMCDLLLPNATITPVEALTNTIQNITGGYCLSVDYEQFIEIERDTNITGLASYFGLRQTTYQLCTQLGWWSTSESPNQPFGSFYPLSFFTEICTRVFGEEVASHAIAQLNQDRFNVEHGGVNPWISNALFTRGEVDPSRTLGVERDLHESAVSLQIPGGNVGYDFYEIYTNDPQVLIEAKLDIMAVIRSWTRN